MNQVHARSATLITRRFTVPVFGNAIISDGAKESSRVGGGFYCTTHADVSLVHWLLAIICFLSLSSLNRFPLSSGLGTQTKKKNKE